MQIKVSYPNIPITELDEKIRQAMELIRAKWCAQGYDFTTRVRNIDFDTERKEETKLEQITLVDLPNYSEIDRNTKIALIEIVMTINTIIRQLNQRNGLDY